MILIFLIEVPHSAVSALDVGGVKGSMHADLLVFGCHLSLTGKSSSFKYETPNAYTALPVKLLGGLLLNFLIIHSATYFEMFLDY